MSIPLLQNPWHTISLIMTLILWATIGCVIAAQEKTSNKNQQMIQMYVLFVDSVYVATLFCDSKCFGCDHAFGSIRNFSYCLEYVDKSLILGWILVVERQSERLQVYRIENQTLTFRIQLKPHSQAFKIQHFYRKNVRNSTTAAI